MIQALYTASTGMIGVQKQIDTTANNIANINTVGFKKSRSEFADLIYKTFKYEEQFKSKKYIEIGLGVKTTGTSKVFSQGTLKQTHNSLDVAIKGRGFFKLRLPDGTEAYSRNGIFKIGKDGAIVNSDGYKLIPEVIVLKDATDINIDKNGAISITHKDKKGFQQIGQIYVYDFINQNNLTSLGDNLYVPDKSLSKVMVDIPGFSGLGIVQQGFVELSNVKLVVELTDLITAQRAYEANSKVIQTSDKMLETTNKLLA